MNAGVLQSQREQRIYLSCVVSTSSPVYCMIITASFCKCSISYLEIYNEVVFDLLTSLPLDDDDVNITSPSPLTIAEVASHTCTCSWYMLATHVVVTVHVHGT